MPLKSQRLKRIQVVAVVFLTVAGIVNYLDRSTLSIANHLISDELHLSASQMGLLLSAFSLSYAFAQLPVGALLDRFGSRVMLGLGMLVWSIAQVAGGIVVALAWYVVYRNRSEVALTEEETAHLNEGASAEEKPQGLSWSEWGALFKLRNTWGYVSLAMLFVNLSSGSAWALVSAAAPRHLVASLGSMQNFGGYLGGSFAPVITGIVVDQTHSFVNALLISAAVAFAAALVYLFVVKEVAPAPLASSIETQPT